MPMICCCTCVLNASMKNTPFEPDACHGNYTHFCINYKPNPSFNGSYTIADIKEAVDRRIADIMRKRLSCQ